MFKLLIPLLAVVFIGVGTALEAPTNALLGKTSGSVLFASFASFVLGTAVLGMAIAVQRPALPGGFLAATPWWAWIGGAYGAFIVLASAWATPKLGAGTTLVVIVASQVALGVVLDNFGWLGLERHPASWLRLVGVAVVFLGALAVGRG